MVHAPVLSYVYAQWTDLNQAFAGQGLIGGFHFGHGCPFPQNDWDWSGIIYGSGESNLCARVYHRSAYDY